MEEETIKVSRSTIYRLGGVVFIIAVISAVFFGGFFVLNSYSAMFVVSFVAILFAGYYVNSKKQELDDMCCMMVGMTFGMMAGFVSGVLVGVGTNNFLLASIVGTAFGLVFGYFFGRIGGSPLSRMEGVMAAPMGGTMGAMIGIMMIPFDLSLFMKFFFFIVVLTMFEIMNVVEKQTNTKISDVMIGAFIGIVAVGFLLTFALAFNAPSLTGTNIVQKGTTAAAAAAAAPGTAVLNNGVQEVTITARASGYDPGTITAKAGVPLKITFKADNTAGCDRTIVFPDFGASASVVPNGQTTLQFTPQKAGTYNFRCSMGMYWGKLIVEN